MKNTIGESFAVTLFGESHGPMIGAVIDGSPPASGWMRKRSAVS